MTEFATRIARLKFRAWHRGTREADYMMGCFFDRFHGDWDEPALAWFEALVEEDDVHILDWVLGVQPAPDRFAGPLMERMKRLDYVDTRR
jgi:antitoxin CptB